LLNRDRKSGPFLYQIKIKEGLLLGDDTTFQKLVQLSCQPDELPGGARGVPSIGGEFQMIIGKKGNCPSVSLSVGGVCRSAHPDQIGSRRQTKQMDENCKPGPQRIAAHSLGAKRTAGIHHDPKQE
jgi:hypothetical protein